MKWETAAQGAPVTKLAERVMTMRLDHPSIDVLFPQYDPSEELIVFLTDEERHEMRLWLIRAGCIKPEGE